MNEIMIDVDKNPIRRLLILSDLHLGLVGACEEEFKKALSELDKDNYTKVLFLGDMVEGREPSHNFYDVNSTTMTVNEQYQLFFEMVRPYRKKVIASFCGNHEDSLNRRTTINPMLSWCRENKIPYCPGVATISLVNKNKRFNILAFHGAGGGTQSGASLNKIINFAYRFADVDLVVCGHFHKSVYSQEQQYGGKIIHVILNGSFLKSYSNTTPIYSEMKALPTNVVSYTTITFSRDLEPIVRLIPVR